MRALRVGGGEVAIYKELLLIRLDEIIEVSLIKPLFAPEDGRIGPKHVELNK